MPELADYSTVSEAALYLNIPESTLYDFIRAGRIGCVKISKRVIRLGRNHILDFMSANTHEPTKSSAR